MATMIKKKGVDISSSNGNVDLLKIKNAGYDFVMIRCGYGSDIKSQDDSQFENNVKKAENIGMPWGAYLYSYATNVAEAKFEVEHVKRLLKGKKPTLPIAFDMEDADGYKAKRNAITKSNITAICKTFINGIKSAGYYPALYTGLYWIRDYISKEVVNSCDLWLAQWSKTPQYNGNNLGMWQYGGETNVLESNSISGIGVIDKNICYKNYPTIIKNGGYNNWTKPTSKPNSKPTLNKVTSNKLITEKQLRQEVCDTINAWVGGTKGSAIHKEILKIYNSQKPLPIGYIVKDNDAWCAATVSATWLKIGIAKYTGTECSCSRFIEVAKKLDIWVESDSYTPKIGDAVIYYWGDNGIGECNYGTSHIGIVTAVSGNIFTVTEGNMGSGIVGKRNMQVNGRYIRGFITPDYKAIAKKISGKVNNTDTNNTNDANKKDTINTNKPNSNSTTKNPKNIPNVIYRVRVDGKWLTKVKNLEDYAGIVGKKITDVAIKVSEGYVKYRVHINGGKWLPWVTGYNTKDSKNGYAGNGKPIDAIEVNYITPNDIKNSIGHLKAKYRVSTVKNKYFDWQYDNKKEHGQDGYAGTFGKTIDRLQVVLSK